MDRPIFMPKKEKYHLAQQNLEWHRKEKFLK
jgi:hypothetical protein